MTLFSAHFRLFISTFSRGKSKSSVYTDPTLTGTPSQFLEEKLDLRWVSAAECWTSAHSRAPLQTSTYAPTLCVCDVCMAACLFSSPLVSFFPSPPVCSLVFLYCWFMHSSSSPLCIRQRVCVCVCVCWLPVCLSGIATQLKWFL